MDRLPTTWRPDVNPKGGQRGAVLNSHLGPGPKQINLAFLEVDDNHPAYPEGSGQIIDGLLYGVNGGGHSGLDVDSELGEPQRTISDGWVTMASLGVGAGGQLGNVVVFRIGAYFMSFAHLTEQYMGRLGVGLPAGTQFGTTGMTGFTTGPHSHWMCSDVQEHVVSSQRPLWNPMRVFALDPITPATLQAIFNDSTPDFYAVQDNPDQLEGARTVQIVVPSPGVLGPWKAE